MGMTLTNGERWVVSAVRLQGIVGSVDLSDASGQLRRNIDVVFAGTENLVADTYDALSRCPEFSGSTFDLDDVATEFPGSGGATVGIPAAPAPGYTLDYDTAQWLPPSAEDAAESVRSERSRLLATSDWTQLPDVPLPTKEAWATYRQALRDLTAQSGFPHNVTWPVPPT